MTASDHLSQGQFMPMDKILKLTSADSKTGGTVESVLPEKRAHMNSKPEVYSDLRDSMKNNGQTRPLGAAEDTMFEGHHRVAIAQDLGWKGMEVSPDVGKSYDDTWDSKHEGN